MVLHDGRPGATFPTSRTRHEAKEALLSLSRVRGTRGRGPRSGAGFIRAGQRADSRAGWPRQERERERKRGPAFGRGRCRRFQPPLRAQDHRRLDQTPGTSGTALRRRARSALSRASRPFAKGSLAGRFTFWSGPPRGQTALRGVSSKTLWRVLECGGRHRMDTEVFKGGVAANKKVLLSREAAGD